MTYCLLFPLWISAGAAAGWYTGNIISSIHPRIQLARQIQLEESGLAREKTVESDYFRTGTTPVSELITEAHQTKRTIKFGTLLLGAYLGAVIGIVLIRYTFQKRRTEYYPDHQACLSCGRCFRYCPQKNDPISQVKSPEIISDLKAT